MCDAYAMSGEALTATPGIAALIAPMAEAPARSFLTIAPSLAKPTPELTRHLKVAKSRFFKAPRLNPLVVAVALAAACGTRGDRLGSSVASQHPGEIARA
jgi:hypothetical protein